MSRGAPALYLVTDRHASGLPLPRAVAAALAEVDPRRVAVQLREKDLSGKELYELGKAVLAECRRRKVPMLVNDRADVARALGADGVHLGGGSLPAREVRKLWPEAWIGISAHSPEELRERAEGADFSTWGPVFRTPSKERYGAPVGLGRLDEAGRVGLPLVGLGGVEESNVANLVEAGFSGVACIRAVFAAKDPGQAAVSLQKNFENRRSKN